MARHSLNKNELELLGAAIKTIGDTSLRRKVSKNVGDSLRSYEPKTWDGENWVSYDWENWTKICGF